MLTLNKGILALGLLAVVAVCLLRTGAQVAPDAGRQSADEAAIRENVRQVQEGWNTKSAALFVQPFAEDADYVAVTGFYVKGRKANEIGHQRLFQSVFKDSTINLAVKQIRFLSPDIALVHVQGHNKTKQGETVREWDLMMTLVMTRDAGKWKIASFHNTMVNEGPGAPRQ
ncbi:MAG TPA: SgcJ/EcaC family oxidoreductase [Pyrinomonadaceae bacterium]